VTHDSAAITFTVKTAKPIVGTENDGDFMRILINGVATNNLGKTVIDGDTMTLVIPRQSLALLSNDFRFEFKFVDSTISCQDPLDWYDHGVVEPLGRLPFVYRATDDMTDNS
jgi:hypothetical protein